MVTIKLHNSYSQVQGFTPELYRQLKKRLSYEQNPGAGYFSGGFPRRVSLINKRGEFPTGLLEEVIEVLEGQVAPYRITDERVVPVAIGSYEVTNEYDWQVEALEAVKDFSRGIISATTGSGKSRVIRNICKQLGVETLIVVPSLEVKQQLAADLADLEYVRVENIDSKALNRPTAASCLIIDEAHHVAAKTYQTLNKTVWKDIYFRYFLTATPFRNQKNEELLFKGIAGDVIYELSYREAVKSKCVVPIEAFYVALPRQNVEGYTWGQVYGELVVNNEHRNALIANQLLMLKGGRKATLCIVKEIKHGKILSDLTGIPFSHGQDEDSRRHIQDFKDGKITSLIGTAGILGEGIDTRPAEFILIAGLGKAKSAFMQQVGRIVRTFPGKETGKVIIYSDPSHKWTKKHFNIQKQILVDEYDATPLRL